MSRRRRRITRRRRRRRRRDFNKSSWCGAEGLHLYLTSQDMPAYCFILLTSCFMEFQRYVGIHTKREIIIDDTEWQVLLPLFVSFSIWVLLYLEFPAIQLYNITLSDV
jgi:hypothetical protein